MVVMRNGGTSCRRFFVNLHFRFYTSAASPLHRRNHPVKSAIHLLTFMIAAGSQLIASAEDSYTSFQNGGHPIVVSGSLTPESQVQWAIELTGYGQSSPVVWRDHVYVTTVDGAQKDVCLVTAFRTADGSKLWQHFVPNVTPQESNNYVSKAAPTPTADELGIVCLFEGGNVIALTHDGSVRWERNLVEDYGPIAARHGLAASVEQSSDSVFLWIERSEDPYIVCLDKQSGEARWKAAGAGATSWAGPRLVPVADGQHLVLSASGVLIGLDPANGQQLWKLDSISGNSTPTPIPLPGDRFLIGATSGRGEDGGNRAAESNGIVRISQATDGSWSASYLWRAKRATSSFSSPIVHAGVALFVNREDVLYGLDVESGEELFAKRLSGSQGNRLVCVSLNTAKQSTSED